MTLISRSITFIFFVLLPFISIGQENTIAKNQSDKIYRIIDETSLGRQLDEWTRDFHSQFSQNPFGLDPNQNKHLMELFLQAFEMDKMLKQVHNSFNQRYNSDHADSVLMWADSNPSREVLETRKEYYTLQGIRNRVVNKYELEQDPPSEERTNLIDSLAHYTAAAKSEVDANAIMFRAMVIAFSKLNNQQSFSDAQVDNFVSNYRDQMASQMNKEVLKKLLVMYHNLDNSVLQKFMVFYKSDAGSWLNTTATESIQSALKAAADRFLNSVDKMKTSK
ncbi:MAG: hypothetical protein PVI44_09485 [Balneolaceae bacterium]|jgi:hypothetical protein